MSASVSKKKKGGGAWRAVGAFAAADVSRAGAVVHRKSKALVGVDGVGACFLILLRRCSVGWDRREGFFPCFCVFLHYFALAVAFPEPKAQLAQNVAPLLHCTAVPRPLPNGARSWNRTASNGATLYEVSTDTHTHTHTHTPCPS